MNAIGTSQKTPALPGFSVRDSQKLPATAERSVLLSSIEQVRWLPGVCLFLLLAAVVLLYWPGLRGGLVLDDYSNLESLTLFAKGDVNWHQVVFGNVSGPLGRPVSMLSFLVNWLTSSDIIWNLKYTNLMLHLLCGTLVFWLALRLLREPCAGVDRGREWVALWITAAWLLAPLLVSTVLYVIQRMTELAALFTFAGLLCYVVGRQTLEARFSRGTCLILAAFLVFLPLAALSKENGALLPLLAFVIELYFFRFRGTPRERRILATVFGLFLLLPAAAALAKTIVDPGWITGGYAQRGFTLSQRLLSEPRILWDYVRQLLIPDGLRMGVYHDDYMKSTGLLAPRDTLLAIAAWLSVLVLAWRTHRTSVALLGFGPLFFLAGHALESTVFPLELYFEHRNYLPAFGIFMSLGIGGAWLLRRLGGAPALVTLLALWPAGYAAATYQRVQVWGSNADMLLSAEQAHPRSPRVHIDLATVYTSNGDLRDALKELDKVWAIRGNGQLASGVALQRLLDYCLTKQKVPAAEYARLANLNRLQLGNYPVTVLRVLADAAAEGRCGTVDVGRVARILVHLPRISPTPENRSQRGSFQFLVGRLLGTSGDLKEAVQHLQRAEQLIPRRPGPPLLALKYQLRLGALSSARSTLARLESSSVRSSISQARVIRMYAAVMERLDQMHAIDTAGTVPRAGPSERARTLGPPHEDSPVGNP